VAALKTIFLYFKAPHLRVQLDDIVIDGRYLMVSIMNGIRMGGGFFMAPAGNPADGHFDLCVVDGMGKMATFPMIMKFMKGTQTTDPRVQMLSSKKIQVTSLSGGIPCHADGETVCESGEKVEVSILPAALRLLV
jgi:diacylglycerol kinase family enzyme